MFGKLKGLGVLDYVCCWYVKAMEYIGNRAIDCAFVSTNSITQGEHVGIFWKELILKHGTVINFAHRTFAWESEARGKAHVHVVIVGFSKRDKNPKYLYVYENAKGNPTVSKVTKISPYLADAPIVFITNRSKPISNVPRMNYGSMAIDKKKSESGLGNLILDSKSRKLILNQAPAMAPYVRRFMGSQEFINSKKRWCLWLVDAPPEVIKKSPAVMERLKRVREFRKGSNRPQTQKLATKPGIFGEIRQSKTAYLLVPKVSSETRQYLPVGFVKSHVIANGSALIVPKAKHFHLGVLSSAMHMAWLRHVGGRMKSDYQMSARLVYNNFPWPQGLNNKQKQVEKVELAAKAVLEARAASPNSTLADLYNPLTMPEKLIKAHAQLDRAVDACYRPQKFDNELARIEFLFNLYTEIVTPLAVAPKKTRKKAVK